MKTVAIEKNTGYIKLAKMLLANKESFKQCSKLALDTLFFESETLTYAKGEFVGARSKKSPNLYLIVEGVLSLSQQYSGGKRYIFGFVDVGNFVGMTSMIDGLGNEHDMWAYTNLTVIAFPMSYIQEMRHKFIDLNTIFELFIAYQMRSRNQLLIENLKPLSIRVAAKLIQLAQLYGLKRGELIQIPFVLPQSDFADLLGVSRQHINKEFNALKLDDLIDFEHGIISIKNSQALKERVG